MPSFLFFASSISPYFSFRWTMCISTSNRCWLMECSDPRELGDPQWKWKASATNLPLSRPPVMKGLLPLAVSGISTWAAKQLVAFVQNHWRSLEPTTHLYVHYWAGWAVPSALRHSFRRRSAVVGRWATASSKVWQCISGYWNKLGLSALPFSTPITPCNAKSGVKRAPNC